MLKHVLNIVKYWNQSKIQKEENKSKKNKNFTHRPLCKAFVVPMSLCPYFPMSLCPNVSMSLCPYIPMSLCSCIHISLCPFIFMYIWVSLYPFVFMSCFLYFHYYLFYNLKRTKINILWFYHYFVFRFYYEVGEKYIISC